jgi:SUMO ligase MMS21 Smc5/6 complex component
MQRVYEVNHAKDFEVQYDDDELIATQATVNIIDPFTLDVMVVPVRSTKCKHTYEKSSIEEVLQKNRNRPVQCPVVGCNQMVSLDDLESDVQMEVVIKRAQKNKSRVQEKDKTSDAIELDEDDD